MDGCHYLQNRGTNLAAAARSNYGVTRDSEAMDEQLSNLSLGLSTGLSLSLNSSPVSASASASEQTRGRLVIR